MNILDWLREVEKVPIHRLRKRMITDGEWNVVCLKYEEWCEENRVKPNYAVGIQGEDSIVKKVYIVTSQSNYGDGWYETPKAFTSRDKAYKEARRQLKKFVKESTENVSYDIDSLFAEDGSSTIGWYVNESAVR